jgi:hypothetical protein
LNWSQRIAGLNLMDGTIGQLDLLLDLEARHDDLLRRLDELDQRVSLVLAEWQPGRSFVALEGSGPLDPAAHPADTRPHDKPLGS